MIRGAPALEHPSLTPTLEGAAGPDWAEPCFALGQLVCDRFEIAGLLGRGGIGEVYEAVDRVLGTRVALKVLSSRWSAHPWAAESLRQEVVLARQVTHPNVCRTFDVFLEPASVEPGAALRPVITMELVRGASLATRLRTAGPLPEAEALELLGQIARGLDAAHAAGVIHRDLKAANVLLTGDGASRRAVITDFGQAVATGEGPGLGRGGTPPYIAPEVLGGEAATPAADLYSFGILMLELSTGRRPAHRHAAPEQAQRAEDLLALPEVSEGFRRAITRCLAADPAARPRRAADALRELEQQSEMRRGRWRRRLVYAGSAVAVAAAFLVGSLVVAPPREPTAPVTPLLRLGFLPPADEGLAAESRGLAQGLTQLLEAELSAGGTILVRASAESTEYTDARTPRSVASSVPAIRQLAGELGCDVMVRGSATPVAAGPPTRFELLLRLVSAEESTPERLVRRRGSMNELVHEIPGLAEELRATLAAPPLARGERTASRARPATMEALLRYGQGREALHRYDAAAARRLFEQAAAADPNFAPTHAGLAEALLMLGDKRTAEIAAERAAALARHLPREQRLANEALVSEAREDWKQAVEIYRALTVFFPQNPSFLRRLALAELFAEDAASARRTITTLREASLGRMDLALADLLDAQAASLAHDFEGQLKAAAEALARLPEGEAPMIHAGALRERGAALHALGRSAEGRQDLEAARLLYRDQGNIGAYAEVSNQLANLVGDLGDLGDAEALYHEALALFRQTGSARREARALSNLAVIAMQRGDDEAAKRLGLEALAICRRIGYRRLEGAVLNNLALMSLSAGNIGDAVTRLEESLTVAREAGNRAGVANTLANLAGPYLSQGQLERARHATVELEQLAADMHFAAGRVVAALTHAGLDIAARNLRQARAHLDRALADHEGLAASDVKSVTLQSEGQLSLLEGDLARAERSLRMAVEISQRAEDLINTHLAQLGLAKVALYDNRCREALRLARAVSQSARQAGHALDAARAEILASRAALCLADREAAREAVENAAGLRQDAQNLEAEMDLELAQARVAAAFGRKAEAFEILLGARPVLADSGFTEASFEAGLLAADIQLSSGLRDAAGAELAELEREARAGGFGLFMPEITRLKTRSR